MSLVTQNKPLGKSMAKVCILDILSDADQKHPLTQRQIEEKLRDSYGIDIERKTLRSHLMQLADAIERIHYSVSPRMTDGKPSDTLSRFWMEREELFDDIEILSLLYGTIFSKHMPTRAKKDLVHKIESLSGNPAHRSLTSYFFDKGSQAIERNQLFWNLEFLSEAIRDKAEVSFRLSKPLKHEGTRVSKERIQVLPLAIGCSNGDYHLVAYRTSTIINMGDYSEDEFHALQMRDFEQADDHIASERAKEDYLESFRLDQIHDVRIAENDEWNWGDFGPSVKDPRTVEFDLNEYVARNPSFRKGFNIRAILSASADDDEIESDLVDHFGVKCISEWDPGNKLPPWLAVDKRYFSVRANSTMIYEYALMNIARVDIPYPPYLRDRIGKSLDTFVDRLFADGLHALMEVEGLSAEDAKASFMEDISNGLDAIIDGWEK